MENFIMAGDVFHELKMEEKFSEQKCQEAKDGQQSSHSQWSHIL
jgi:hypothetical protein